MMKRWGHPGQQSITYYSDDDDQEDGGVLPVRWVPPGQSVQIQGLTLPGGMIYVGQGVPHSSVAAEPSLIDPHLPVDGRIQQTGWVDRYWMSYRAFEPPAREAYLTWHAGDRRDPDIPIEYAILFLYGIERRVGVDIAPNRSLQRELPLLRAEVERLLEVFERRDWTLTDYFGQLISYIDLILMDPEALASKGPPELNESKLVAPLELGLGLGALVAARQDIPADWALAWAWFLPDVRLRASATRTTDEFSRLFALRYHEQFGNGLSLRRGARKLEVSFHAENHSLTPVQISVGDLPDVFLREAPARKLAALFADVSAELDAYSRWLIRNPGKPGTIAILAHLPDRLLREPVYEQIVLQTWLDRHLGLEKTAVVKSDAVLDLWGAPPGGKLSKAESLALAQVFARFGLGIEPDVRFGGASIAPGKQVVVFQWKSPDEIELSSAYPVASTIAHLGTAVLAADGPPTHATLAELIGSIALCDAVRDGLEPSEMVRLHASLVGLSATAIKLTGFRKRLDVLTDEEKVAAGDVLIGAATRDGAISPAAVTTVMTCFRLLQLDPATVTSRLHAGLTGAQSSRSANVGSGFALDRRRIDATERETNVVSDLLGSIFAEDEPASIAPVVPGKPSPAGESIAGLDALHTQVLTALVDREVWSATEFATLAATHHLLAAGAIDTLNEFSLDLTGDPLIEGDDPLTIDLALLQELLP